MMFFLTCSLLIFLAMMGLVSPAKSFQDLGLGDYEREPAKPFDGFIYHNRLQVKDLTEFKYFDMFCRGNYATFTQCTEDYHDIKVLYSSDTEDVKERVLNDTIDFHTGRTRQWRTRSYAPHLVALKNVFVNSWGFIYNYDTLYNHGGCTNRALYHPPWHYNMSSTKVHVFNQPILSLVHPYSPLFFHEFVEVHAAFIMALRVLQAVPNIPVLLNKELRYPQLFPLLEIFGISPAKLNLQALGEPFKTSGLTFVAYAPYVITSVSHWCEYISGGVINEMRRGYSKLPYWGNDGNGILIYDRYNIRPKRFITQGYDIYSRLYDRYNGRYPVRMYYGNESLEETAKLFRQTKVLIGAHGAGLSNILFMPKDSMMVELRPISWPNRCFIDMANYIGIKHYLYNVNTNLRGYEMNINLKEFMDILIPMIDATYGIM